MKKILLTSVAAVAVLAASQAMAADANPVVTSPVTYTAPPAAPSFSWTGGYVGGFAGLGRGALSDGFACDYEGGTYTEYYFLADEGDLANCDEESSEGSLDPNNEDFVLGEGEGAPALRGLVAGAQIGYNYQFGNGPNGFVIGAEVTHAFTTIGAQFDASTGGTDWTSNFEINRLTTATIHAGYAFGRVLAYGEVGFAIGETSWANTLGLNDTDSVHGLVWGAGVEAAMGDNVSIFAEYNRVKLNNASFLGQTYLFGDLLPTAVNVNATANVFKLGFNIHLH